MTTAGRRCLIVLPLAGAIGLAWLGVELVQRLSTYWTVVSLLPFPGLALFLAYVAAWCWWDGEPRVPASDS